MAAHMTGEQIMGYANCFQLYSAAVEQAKYLEENKHEISNPDLFKAHADYMESLERMMILFAQPLPSVVEEGPKIVTA